MSESGHRVPLADASASLIIEDAQTLGQVIKCIGAGGVTQQFRSVEHILDNTWVVHSDMDGDEAHLCQTPTVHNCIKLCDPDVFLVREQDSWFGGEDGK